MKARWEHAKEEIMEGMFAAAAAAYDDACYPHHCVCLNSECLKLKFVFQFVSMGVLLRTSMVCNCICLGTNVLGLRTRSKPRESNEQIRKQYNNFRREKKANDASKACEESSSHVCWRFPDHMVVPYSLPASDCDSWQVSLPTIASDCNLCSNPRLAEFDCLHSSKIYAIQGEESWH